MKRSRRSVLILILLFSSIFTLALFGPAERSLGGHVRVVYLHGAWVWTALLAFAGSGILALVGLLGGGPRPLDLSGALAKTATVFWVTYLPLSLWAMQANWNGLFLDEPRWRLGLDFAVVAILAQLAIRVVERQQFSAAVNLAYCILLFSTLAATPSVMHPDSPVFGSGARSIQAFFLLLLLLCLAGAWQLTRIAFQTVPSGRS